MHRRQFVRRAIACACIPAAVRLRAESFPTGRKSILVLGGTEFLGPQVVLAALAAGHDVTLFNRGMTHPELFPMLRKLRGTRSVDPAKEDLTALRTGHWDAVIDVWPSEPEMVTSAATLLHDRTGHYLYVSSIAAYDVTNYAHAETREEDKLRVFHGHEEDYGARKAESERRLHALAAAKLTIVRPGAIEGSPSWCSGGLMETWLSRVMDGRRHIGPGDGMDPIQLVDVKDVGSFIAQSIAHRTFGTFNLVRNWLPLRDHIQTCKEVTHSDADFVWIPRAFLEGHGLPPAAEIGDGKPQFFTGWIPRPAIKGLYQMSNTKALATGWRPRPFAATATDILAPCAVNSPVRLAIEETLSPEKEAEVLQAWADLSGHA